MPVKGDEDRIRDPLEEGEDKSETARTSGNREESMTESGKDAFGSDSAIRNPDSTSQGDGTADESDTTNVGRSGRQKSATSGTTPLGGEPRGGAPEPAPGGVEGESGTS